MFFRKVVLTVCTFYISICEVYYIFITFKMTQLTEKINPIIIEEDTTAPAPVPVQVAQVAVGIVQLPPAPNYPPQHINYNQNQPQYNNMYGQPPNYMPPPQRQHQHQPQQGYYNPGPYYNNMPPPPQYAQSPALLILSQQPQINPGGCPSCGFIGNNFTRRSLSCQGWAWCVCLFCFTGIFCFWVPLVMDSCYDMQVICSRCGIVKARVQA